MKTFATLLGVVLGIALAQNLTTPNPNIAPNAPKLSPLEAPTFDYTESVRAFTAVSASRSDNRSTAAMAIDGKSNTWWSTNYLNTTITFDLGQVMNVSGIDLSFYKGNERVQKFAISTSLDNVGYKATVADIRSSGNTLVPERFSFQPQTARYVRLTMLGNSKTASSTVAEATAVIAVPNTVAYYLDCQGSDTASGRGPGEAIRTLGKANSLALKPGEQLLLKRGCSFTGNLTAKWNGTDINPVLIGAYGSGPLPVVVSTGQNAVTVSGSYQRVRDLEVKPAVTPRPSPEAVKCKTTPLGWLVGINVTGRYNHVSHVVARGFTAGVSLPGDYNKITHSEMTNNTVMSKNNPDNGDNDSGAWGTLVNGDYNEVAYNRYGGNTACSEDYAREGASIELYKASHTYIHHNISINDSTLTEMGGTRDNPARHNRLEYNLFAPIDVEGGEFLVIRGPKSKWSDNIGTVFRSNTGYLVNVGIYCGEGCSPEMLVAEDNLIVSRKSATKAAIWTDGPFVEARNLVMKDGAFPQVVIPGGISRSSFIADPSKLTPAGVFVNLQALNFSLRSTVPIRSAGAFPLAPQLAQGPVQLPPRTVIPEQPVTPEQNRFPSYREPTIGSQ